MAEDHAVHGNIFLHLDIIDGIVDEEVDQALLHGAERGRDEGEDIEQNLPSPFVDSDKVTKIDSFCSEIMVILYQF